MCQKCSIGIWIWILFSLVSVARAELPQIQSHDPRLAIELFAEHPQLVTPTGIAVAGDGAVYVAESQTHFRPDDYDGPQRDRILVFRDTDDDGRADQREIFHSGFTHVMDIEFHPDGSLYVATRMDIHRLQDTTRDGRADRVTPIVRMDTAGTYPHNGLSGLSFDFAGNLVFGLGENLGQEYTLIGTDGRKLAGGGEGGSTYTVKADGSELRRVSTGWWNPFGTCVDAFERVFGTDNDPGASPPCRLIQIVSRADYGYEYRYGRTGLHPLITWTGDSPGTLPMIAGTGEAPCAIEAYESDAWPEVYRGQLLVASWADHRVERYVLKQSDHSALVSAERQVLISSHEDFRPVGLAVAPDGDVFVSDWVSSSYQLHRLGRIWRIRAKDNAARTAPRPVTLDAADRRRRETAARQLLETEVGRAELAAAAQTHQDPRVRATAVSALASQNISFPFEQVAAHDPHQGVQRLALREHLLRGGDPAPWLGSTTPAVLQFEALFYARSQDVEAIAGALRSNEPTLVHAAIVALTHHPRVAREWIEHEDPRLQLGGLLALKRHPLERTRFAKDPRFVTLLSDADDPRVQYSVVKWIADERLSARREELRQMLHRPDLDYRVFLALVTAIDRLEDRDPQDRPSTDGLLGQLTQPGVSDTLRALALRLLDPADAAVDYKLLERLTDDPEPSVRWEAVRTLAGHPDRRRIERLTALAEDPRQPQHIQGAAVAGLASSSEEVLEPLMRWALQGPEPVRDEALRSLVGCKLDANQRSALQGLAQREPGCQGAVERLLAGAPGTRPPSSDVQAWLQLIPGHADPDAGRRIFFGTKVGTCAKCHQVEGRGSAVGPDLTSIHRRLQTLGDQADRWLLETILQPSRDMAPQYTPWQIVTVDGQQLVGLPRRKGGNAEAYFGVDGKEFTVRKDQIEFHGEMDKSLMPDGLLEALTVQELRDLFAFIRM